MTAVGTGAHLRPFRAADLDAVLALERAIFPNPWGRDHFAQALESGPALARVAEEHGRVIGYAIGWVVADEAELANLAVAEGGRRHGVGGRLLHEFLDEAAGRGARRVYLGVRDGNRAARALYERHGFTVLGRRSGYYDSPREDAITMVRDLAVPESSSIGPAAGPDVPPGAVDSPGGRPVALAPTRVPTADLPPAEPSVDAPVPLLVVWDYDSALGMANTSYPYDWDAANVDRETRNVARILDLAGELSIRMTFACLGFAAEPGPPPFHAPDRIREIAERGHEVASHSWRHEWFPFLEREQVRRSLARSRMALERVAGEGAVRGFVPPFSRPMSWRRKGALSRGDRARLGPGGDLGTLMPLVAEAGYSWCRVSWRPLWHRLRGGDPLLARLDRPWTAAGGVTCVPQHYTGFDEGARRLLAEAVRRSAPLVVVGHPSGLDRDRTEHVRHLEAFMREAAERRDRGEVSPTTVAAACAARAAAR